MKFGPKGLSVFGLLAGVVFTLSCAAPPRRLHEVLDGSVDSSTDTVATLPDRSCDPENVMDDFFHCGGCGEWCHPSNNDQCVEGTCRCGTGPSCAPGTDCRTGRCVPVDPTGRHCEFDSDCLASFACIEQQCSFVRCTAEECDGYDNDCDGKVDEGPSTSEPMARFCYDGGTTTDPWSIMPPCRSGVQACNDGIWSECFGEEPPVEETGLLGCDTIDNNCDGCMDGELAADGTCVPFALDGFDILYAFDTSGSMREETRAVIEATRSFSSSLDRPDMRFGIAVVPGLRMESHTPALALDFTDFATFDAFLGSEGTLPTGLGNEPNWDVIEQAADGTIPRMSCEDLDENGSITITECMVMEPGISWRERSIRIIILFTDEEGQSYKYPGGGTSRGIDENEMCASMTHGEVLVVVNELQYHEDFDCDGRTILFELTEDAVEMAANLSSVLVDPCTGAASMVGR